MTKDTFTAPNSQQVGSIRIKQEIQIQAPVEKVFAALTQDTSFWWGAPFLLGENPKKIIIEPKLGGMMYEDWGNGDGATWGTITEWHRNKSFEYHGRCGMTGAVTGYIRISLEASDSNTVLKLEHDAIGHVTEESLESYNWGWDELLNNRLRAYLEKGECLGLLKK